MYLSVVRAIDVIVQVNFRTPGALRNQNSLWQICGMDGILSGYHRTRARTETRYADQVRTVTVMTDLDCRPPVTGES